MPNRDKTGPAGQGPKTGRGWGPCAPGDSGAPDSGGAVGGGTPPLQWTPTNGWFGGGAGRGRGQGGGGGGRGRRNSG